MTREELWEKIRAIEATCARMVKERYEVHEISAMRDEAIRLHKLRRAMEERVSYDHKDGI